MKRKAHTSKNYKFTQKKHSGPGVAALVFSFVPLLLFGCIGLAAVLLAFATLRVSVKEARKENVIKKVPVAGAIMSVLMIIGWGAVYVIGWTGL